MFAVDHAATALLIKRRFPSVPLTPVLVSVQAMELAWVSLNYLGIERTTTASSVRSVVDIHLAYMPFSHSVATACGGALLAWLVIEKGLGRPLVGRAIGIGIVSHLVLDVMTHARDIAGASPSRWRMALSVGGFTEEAGRWARSPCWATSPTSRCSQRPSPGRSSTSRAIRCGSSRSCSYRSSRRWHSSMCSQHERFRTSRPWLFCEMGV